MDVELLWGFLVFWLIFAAAIIALEQRRPESEVKVLLIFLENNEESVEAVLRDICRKARCGKAEVHLLVIDNCSTDATVSIIKRLIHYFPQINIVDRGKPRSADLQHLEFMLGKVFKVLDFRNVCSRPQLTFANNTNLLPPF